MIKVYRLKGTQLVLVKSILKAKFKDNIVIEHGGDIFRPTETIKAVGTEEELAPIFEFCDAFSIKYIEMPEETVEDEKAEEVVEEPEEKAE